MAIAVDSTIDLFVISSFVCYFGLPESMLLKQLLLLWLKVPPLQQVYRLFFIDAC